MRIPGWLHVLQWALLLTVIAFRFAEPVGDGDLFWQMAYGRYLLEHKTLIPDHTIYSWTPGDNPYIYCSWFAEIALYLIYRLGGLPLLFAFRYAVVLSVPLLVYFFARRIGPGGGWERRPELFYMLTWLTLASYVGSILKPELFSLGFMSVFAWCLYSFRLSALQGKPYRGYLVGMVLTLLFWANSHGVFFFGLIALGAFTAGELFNWWASPGLALPVRVRKDFLATVLGCGLAAFCTPYHYHFVAQLCDEAFGVLFKRQSAGDAAAYASLAAHLPIWKAPSFHFQEYLAVGVVLAVVVGYWLTLYGPRRGRIDYSYLTVNGLLGLIFTVYLRSTFYWPIFFVYSTLYLIAVLREQGCEDPARAEQGWGRDFVLVSLVLAFAHGFFTQGLDSAVYLKMNQEKAVQVVFVVALVAVVLVAFFYTWFRVLPPPEMLTDPEESEVGKPLPPRRSAGFLVARPWLAGVALVAQLFLCGRACWEACMQPYAASWFGFGITYWNPVDEVEFLQKYHPDLKTIINDYDSGGYLIWKLFPQTRVMIDPRSFPYRKFWADYIRYERGEIGLEFLDRFQTKLPEVSLVSLKNTQLWRTYLRASDRWVPAWVGTAYVVFVRRGHSYPPDAAQFRPGRFETLRNAQKALQIYQFGIESNLYSLSWEVLDVMKRKFNTTQEQRAVVTNLDAYKRCILAIQSNKLDEAIAAQEECSRYRYLFNSELLLKLYQVKLSGFRKAGKKETDPEVQAFLQRARSFLQAPR